MQWFKGRALICPYCLTEVRLAKNPARPARRANWPYPYSMCKMYAREPHHSSCRSLDGANNE